MVHVSCRQTSLSFLPKFPPRSFCVIIIFLCLISTNFAFAQHNTYEEKIQFLHRKLAELKQVKAKIVQEQINLYTSHGEYNSLIKPWKQLELRSRNMIDNVESMIRQAEVELFQDIIEKYTGENENNISIPDNITLTRLDGKIESIQAYRGKVVLLHFWATWCRPCINEIPSLKRFYDRFDSNNFEILAVSLDARRKDIKNFLDGREISFSVYFDPGRTVYREIIKGLEILPRSILIDKTGKIFKSYAGEQQWESQDTIDDVRTLLSVK